MPNSEEVMLTKEQQWRLAELVTGEKYAIQGEPGHEEIFLAIPHDDEWEPDIWEPSLDKDSEDWQQAQALRVIVAAMSLPSMMNVHRYSNGYAIEYWSGMEGRETPVCPDILQASTMALLHGAES